MAKILLVNQGSLGDLHPFIGLGLALQRAGHSVKLGTGDAYQTHVESAGIEFVSIGPHLDPHDPEIIAAVLDPRDGPRRLHVDYVFPGVERSLNDLLPHLRDSDLLISGVLAYFSRTASELTGVPWMTAILSPALLWSAEDPPAMASVPFLRALRIFGPGVLRILYRGIFAVSRPWAKPLFELRRKHGLSEGPHPFREGLFSPYLNLYLFSRHFAAPQPDWPLPYAQPGFIAYDGGESALSPRFEAFLGAGAPPVLMTLGSTQVHHPGKIFETFAEALRLGGRRGLLLAGSKGLERWKHLESESLLVEGYAPYSNLMSRCAAIVHQGGIGTTAQALKSGRPSLVVGVATDQLDNGRHVQALGAGTTLKLGLLTPLRLHHAIERLLGEPTWAERAGRVSEQLRAEEAETIAVREIEKFLAAGSQ